MEDDFTVITEPRRYFGPVDITKLKINLCDDRGRLLDMNAKLFFLSRVENVIRLVISSFVFDFIICYQIQMSSYNDDQSDSHSDSETHNDSEIRNEFCDLSDNATTNADSNSNVSNNLIVDNSNNI